MKDTPRTNVQTINKPTIMGPPSPSKLQNNNTITQGHVQSTHTHKDNTNCWLVVDLQCIWKHHSLPGRSRSGSATWLFAKLNVFSAKDPGAGCGDFSRIQDFISLNESCIVETSFIIFLFQCLPRCPTVGKWIKNKPEQWYVCAMLSSHEHRKVSNQVWLDTVYKCLPGSQ